MHRIKFEGTNRRNAMVQALIQDHDYEVVASGAKEVEISHHWDVIPFRAMHNALTKMYDNGYRKVVARAYELANMEVGSQDDDSVLIMLEDRWEFYVEPLFRTRDVIDWEALVNHYIDGYRRELWTLHEANVNDDFRAFVNKAGIGEVKSNELFPIYADLRNFGYTHDKAVETMVEDGHISGSILSGVKFDDCLADAKRLIGKGFFPALDDFEAEPKVEDVMFKVLIEYDLMKEGEVEAIHKNSIPGIRKKVFAFFEKWLPYVANEQEKKMYQDLLG